jgi:D-3-phosphoglycerate dehydrogenase
VGLLYSTSGKPHIVVLDDWQEVCGRAPAIRALAREFTIDIHTGHLIDRDELVKQLRSADIIVPFRERTKFDREVLVRLPNLQLIAQTGGGAAHIDVRTATDLGIAIALTPGASATSVAELCLGLLLVLFRRIAEADRVLHGGGWPILPGHEIAGHTLGIAGYGNVGRAFATRAVALGMRVLAWNRTPVHSVDQVGVTFVESFDQLLPQVDCLSLHLLLTPETEGIVDMSKLRLMKREAVLINTARGALVVEDDLSTALREGIIRGAALDVYSKEPLAPDSPLRNLVEVVLTPHVGWTTTETQERYLDGAAANIKAFVSEQYGSLINQEAVAIRARRAHQ